MSKNGKKLSSNAGIIIILSPVVLFLVLGLLHSELPRNSSLKEYIEIAGLLALYIIGYPLWGLIWLFLFSFSFSMMLSWAAGKRRLVEYSKNTAKNRK